jgi:hypothetical protein
VEGRSSEPRLLERVDMVFVFSKELRNRYADTLKTICDQTIVNAIWVSVFKIDAQPIFCNKRKNGDVICYSLKHIRDFADTFVC